MMQTILFSSPSPVVPDPRPWLRPRRRRRRRWSQAPRPRPNPGRHRAPRCCRTARTATTTASATPSATRPAGGPRRNSRRPSSTAAWLHASPSGRPRPTSSAAATARWCPDLLLRQEGHAAGRRARQAGRDHGRRASGHDRELLQKRDLYYPAGTRTYQYLIELEDGTFLVVDTVLVRGKAATTPGMSKIVDKMMQTLGSTPEGDRFPGAGGQGVSTDSGVWPYSRRGTACSAADRPGARATPAGPGSLRSGGGRCAAGRAAGGACGVHGRWPASLYPDAHGPCRRQRLCPPGPAGSRAIRMGTGVPACLTVTAIDGLVLAKSAFHHSANYRSVVLLGAFRLVKETSDSRPSRRSPTSWSPDAGARCVSRAPRSSRASAIVSMPIEEASAKARTGPASR